MSLIEHDVWQVHNIFLKAGYRSFMCSKFPSRRICFDVIARNPAGNTVVVKVVTNIDGLSKQVLSGMKVLSYLINAFPIIVGKENRHSELVDNAVYYRLDIASMNIRTFYNLIVKNIPPYIIVSRGNLICKIDGEKLRKTRISINMSRKELSELLNISVKTVSEYERCHMKSTVERAEQIEKILRVRIIMPISVFRKVVLDEEQKKMLLSKPDIKSEPGGFIEELYEIFEEIGLQHMWLTGYRSPFDVFVKITPTGYEKRSKSGNISGGPVPPGLISAVFTNITKKDEIRLKIIGNILELLGIASPIFVEDDNAAKKAKRARIPVIEKDELKEVRNEGEFRKLLIKKAT